RCSSYERFGVAAAPALHYAAGPMAEEATGVPLSIRCKGLQKTYDEEVVAVDGLDLDVKVGECFGLLGPNGAGKTTTVEILEGLKPPTSGEVEVLGLRWSSDDRAIRERIGVTLQETRFPDKETVRELLIVFRTFYRSVVAIVEAIARVPL